MLKLVLKGGYLVAEDFQGPADIGVDHDGRIAVIGSFDHNADTVLDVSGTTVIPGCFDAHVHIRAPGYAEREDAQSGTLAALTGGITSLAEMPMADKGTSSVERLNERIAVFARDSYTDFGFFGGGGQGSLEAIPGMAASGVLGFKSFMRPAYANRAVSFEGTTVESEDGLDAVVSAIARTGLPWLVHAENVNVKAAWHTRMTGGGEQNLSAEDKVLADRWSEIEGVRTAIAYARASGAKLHVVHVTAKESIEEILHAQVDVDVTGEACIPHLTLIDGDADVYGPLALVSPPAKHEADREALWRSIESGALALISSDHASFAPNEYEDLLSGRTNAALGIPSLEHLVPMTLTMADRYGISQRAAVSALTARAARRFGIWPKKGSLSVGADADLVVLDTTSRRRINQSKLRSKGKYTPFNGWELGYHVQGVVSHGRVAVWGDEVYAKPGWGEMLRPVNSER